MSTFDAAALVLRLGVGVIFAVHGAQKAFGWWGGSGLAGWEAVMVRMGFRPARLFAVVSVIAELGGGLALALGLLTPLAATLLIGQSLVIIFAAHWSRGFFNRDNGYEFPLALIAGVIAVLLLGPGEVSVDQVVGFALGGDVRAWLVALGIAGGLATTALPRLFPGPATPATNA